MVGELDEAESVLTSVLTKNPSHSHAWTNIGRIHLLRGNGEEGERALRQAIALDPENVESRFRLVKKYLREGRRTEARRLVQEIRNLEEGMARHDRIEH